MLQAIRPILSTAAVLALVAPGISGAATPGPAPPSIDQYIEQIPTPSGPQSPTGEERVQPLPPEIERRVEVGGGSDAAALEEIATSSRYGAQVEAGDRPAQRVPPPAGDEPPAQGDEQVALEPASIEPNESGDVRVFVLVAFIAGSLLAAGAYEVVRRRSRRAQG